MERKVSRASGQQRGGYRHEALLYAGGDDFVARAVPIIAGAVEAREPVLVAVDAAKIERLRDELGRSAASVAWKDIRGIGGNPARIIPVWRQFVAAHRAREGRLWGFGEPVWAGRSPAELVEAQRHEVLLNHAFADDPPFTLLCPYDTDALDAGVIAEAHHSHPAAPGAAPLLTADPLPELPGTPIELDLDRVAPGGLHRFLAERVPGLDPVRVDDLAIAIAAIANGMGRLGARSRVRVWQDLHSVIAEIGRLVPVADPLAGREWPPPGEGPARGLWLANQLCDLVQFRSPRDGRGGALVRLHVGR